MKSCNSKLKTVFFLAILFFSFFGLAKSSQAATELTVTKVTRISHPAYRTSNVWYGARDPWNSDYTRLMLYESPAFTHPEYGKTGRGLVWGTINNLKSWTTLTEYENAAKPLQAGYDNFNWRADSVYWSPFIGEENVIYGLYTYYSTTVRRLNLDTGTVTIVVSYDPGDGTDVSNARALGWTTDNKLVVGFNDITGCCGYEIDVQTGSRTRYYSQPSKCSDEGNRWPLDVKANGHMHLSPDKKREALYGYGYIRINEPGVDCITEYKDPYYPNNPVGKHIGHVSWRYSNDWLLAGDVGDFDGCNFTAPHMDTYGIYQIYFDRTTHEFDYYSLLKKEGAGLWCDGSNYRNYHALPLATLRSDGNQIHFMSTDGLWSYDDYTLKGKTPWGTEGVFLADLALASDTIPPSAPSGLAVN
ncbi:MAG: hypothetical protein V1858_01405 [Candidatus Gottesmanbacteria bacterium]